MHSTNRVCKTTEERICLIQGNRRLTEILQAHKKASDLLFYYGR